MTETSDFDIVSTRQRRMAALAKQSPQMGFISLNHHLDLPWLREAYRRARARTARAVQPRLKGQACPIRCADDAFSGVPDERDARRVLDGLPKRLGRYGLRLHPEKTRLVRFHGPPRRTDH